MHPQTAPVPSNFLGAIVAPPSLTANNVVPEVLKSDPSPPPVTVSTPVTPVMMWSSQTANNANGPAEVMMPPPNNLVTNPMMSRRSSASLLILPDNLKTEVLDENSQSSLIGENSMSGMTTHTNSAGASPLEQLVNENSRESSQNGLMMNNVPVNGSPVPDALLGVVDIMRNQQQLSILPPQPSFNALHETTSVSYLFIYFLLFFYFLHKFYQLCLSINCNFIRKIYHFPILKVKVLSPHNINKDAVPVLTSESNISNNLQGSPGVVDLRMKHHQPEFNGIGNGNLGSFAATPPDQPLPAQSGHSIEKYLEQIETAPKKPDIVQVIIVKININSTHGMFMERFML